MIIELLTTTLGVTIAKIALGYWLKNPDFYVEATTGVVDLLLKLTNDALAARKGNRQYEVISEKAAERLSYFIECEFGSLTENSLTSVVFAVNDTIDSSKPTLELLTKYNLDPNDLSSYYMKKSRKYTKDLSLGEIELYERLLVESCNLSIEFGSQLPSFTLRTLAAVLKREDVIISSIERVSEQFRQLQEASYKKSALATRSFGIEYRRALIRNLGWMELFGADLSVASRKHSLSIAYINLSMKTRTNGETEKEITIRADQAIQKSRCLFIRGAAGSGKTTLLKWIAVKAASEDFDENLKNWNYLTPFFVKLRQCVDLSDLPSPEMFPRFIVPHIYSEMPKEWVHASLRSGEAIVLIDGVDEISKRDKVKVWVESLAETFDKTRFIVTSRPLAKSDKWDTPKGFEEADMLPMEPSDISLFIDSWYEAVKAELQSQSELDRMENLAENLKLSVHKNYALRSLASTPLLCAMVCALHKDKNKQIPSGRLDLYESCTKMLVDEREREREIKIAEYPDFSYKEKISLLSDLAYYLITNNYSEIDRARAKERIAKSLLHLKSSSKKISPSVVVDFLLERTGILREPTAGVLDFAHRTFQEYLAAKKAVDDDDIGVLIQHAKDVQWREVIILAAGLANQKQKQELLENLILSGDIDPENKYWLHLLAIACLETVTDVNPSTLKEIRDRIEQLIPPKDITQSIALASAGDLSVSHLEHDKGHSPRLCIKTLELINSPLSLQALIGYANLPREDVLNVLLPTLQRVIEDEHGRQLLYELEILEMTLKGNAVRIIRYVNNINKLTIRNFAGDKIDDLAFLQTKDLEINNCQSLETLDGLSKVYRLRKLSIVSCPIVNIREISLLTKLEELTLDGLERQPDVNIIVTLRFLKNLTLSNLNIEDLSGLIQMQYLKKLTLDNCTSLVDVDAFEKLISLRYLVIKSCPNVESLKSLSQLKNIDKIEIKDTVDNANRLTNTLDRSMLSKISTRN